jgi:simple sugar transport system ATP-binding protein
VPPRPRSPILLSLQGVAKRFGAVQALAGVNVEFRTGEVHAVLGENGAGKSTLMNAIYGLVRVDEGRMFLDGKPAGFRSPLDARRAGIGMVHQEFTLVEQLSVAENLGLALNEEGHRFFNRDRTAERAHRLADEIGLELPDPDAPVGRLAVGARQRLEILKALAGDTRILILDEPTAVLTPAETAQLFRVLDRLRARGASVLFITHKLGEVKQIADRVTVLRHGQIIATANQEEMNESDLAELMVGASMGETKQLSRRSKLDGEVLLRVEHLQVGEPDGREALDDVSLEARAGELIGIAGVDGNGQLELFEVLVGLRAPARGVIRVAGKPIPRFEPAVMMASGIGSIPPDRRRHGLVAGMSIRENAVLNRVLLRRLSRGLLLSPAASENAARDLMSRYAIRADDLESPAARLSGGNQQRLVVGRALSLRPRVLVAFNPTRGLDISAARFVHSMLDEALQEGTAVLLISTDLDEVMALSDGVAVLYRGRLSEVMRPPVPVGRVAMMMGTGAS